MKKLPLLTLTALFLASGVAVAGDHGEHHGWGHRHHHHYHHNHYAPPSYYVERHYYEPPSYYYYPRYYAPQYYAPQYYSPGFNAHIQRPDYGVHFGFSGSWDDR